MSGLAELAAAGVAVWLDDLGRHRLDTGQLAALVESGRVVGVTSNPSIFAAAVGDGGAYASDLATLAAEGISVDEAATRLTIGDVQRACDLLLPVFEATGGRDGRVSLEVDPRLAYDTEATVEQAAALHAHVARPNLMVKIPATEAGLPAVTAALAGGISVNVTLIFSVDRYRSVVDAWLSGLEQALAAGMDLSTIHSVASFFISRLDTAVDRILDQIGSPETPALRGQAALANARLAFEYHEQVLASPRWASLSRSGAQPQRPLWASTGTKDHRYSDTMYVSGLVTQGTVTTLPMATLEAFEDHGVLVGDTVRPHYDQARQVVRDLAELGIDLPQVLHQLEVDGVAAFDQAWTDLLNAVEAALRRIPT